MTGQPRGYAATAAEFLGVSAEDTGAGDLAVRQLAATQAIGYALLALDGLAVTQPCPVLASFRRACEALRGRIAGGAL